MDKKELKSKGKVGGSMVGQIRLTEQGGWDRLRMFVCMHV